MRRAEPAPDHDEAAEAARMAHDALRHWKFQALVGLLGVLTGLRGTTHDPLVIQVLGVVLVVTALGMAAWAFLSRQAALRVLDANRRRWGGL
jgi:protein-S-isoprenylcysteine O-methyltransferase Ste14